MTKVNEKEGRVVPQFTYANSPIKEGINFCFRRLFLAIGKRVPEIYVIHLTY